MKHITVIFKVFLLIAILASLAACSGGTFMDPGYEAAGGGDNGGGGSRSGMSKPAKLSSSAGYDEALAKLDEIIDYCDAHTGPINDGLWSTANFTYSLISQKSWAFMGPDTISSINAIIDQLQ